MRLEFIILIVILEFLVLFLKDRKFVFFRKVFVLMVFMLKFLKLKFLKVIGVVLLRFLFGELI